MSKIISLFFWVILIVFSIVAIIRSNTDYKSLSYIKCERIWNTRDTENKYCIEKIAIDDIDKIEDKQIGAATKNYDVSVFYTTFWIAKLDSTLKTDLERIVADFKDIRIKTNTTGQLIITSKYLKFKDETHNFLSIVFEKRKIIQNQNEEKSYLSYVYDINRWEFLTIQDVFISEWTPLGIVYPNVKEKIKEKIPWTNEDLIARWTWKSNYENYKLFYIDNKKLVFIFPAWQVADSALWDQIIEIPFFEIEYVLNKRLK